MSDLPFLRRVALIVLLCGAAVLPAAAGCGGRKKPLTIKERLVKARAEKTPDAQARELTRVARSQFQAGDKMGAIKTLTEAKDKIPAEGMAAVNGPRLVEIGGLYAEMEEKKLGLAAVRQAVAGSETIDDAVTRIRLLADAGAVYGPKEGGLGDPKSARDALAKAVELAGGVEDRFKAQALAAIAVGYTRANLAKEAGKIVEQLEASARELPDPRPKAEALAAAANVRSQTGDEEAAVGLLKEAADVAKKMSDKGMAVENRTYALLAVATAYLESGDAKEAAKLLKLAEKSAVQISDPESQKNGVEKVRQMQSKVGRKK